MSFLSVNNLRNRRVSNQNNIFGPTQMTVSNFHSDSRQTQGMLTALDFPACNKNDLKMSFGDELFIQNLHLIPDPLKKNLADTLITEEKPKPKSVMGKDYDNSMEHRMDTFPTLSGITSFFSGVFNVLTSVMFKRAQSPVDLHNRVVSESQEMAPASWQQANQERDKNELAEPSLNCNKTNLERKSEPDIKTDTTTMAECKNAVLQCEDKLKKVQELLSRKQPPTKSRRRRPKKAFVEAGSVEDCFEDAFCPEDFVSVVNDPYIEYYTAMEYHTNELCEIQSPLLMTRGPAQEHTEFEKNIVNNECTTEQIVDQTPNLECSNKREVVSSCEDKLAKLKAILQENRTKVTQECDTSPTEAGSIKDKKLKNRTTNKHTKSQIKRNIDEDMLFANEILLDDSSVDGSPDMRADKCPFTEDEIQKDGFLFDEVRGRFHTDSLTDSEEAFQIVVSDCPRRRRSVDCDSEDSFIVFEESPDSCYTANDVFDYDSDEESELSDSGCMTTLSHALTKSVTNLTEDCLYEEQCADEVDCAFESNCGCLCEGDSKSGVLLDAGKKLLKKNLPGKKVTFSTQPPEVRVMRVWAYAAKQARIGNWERYSRDRDRFKRRIADVDMAVSWVLKPQHRSRVVFQRFMPWWNAEKRRELAEKLAEEKQKEIEAGTEESSTVEAKQIGNEANNSEVGDLKVTDTAEAFSEVKFEASELNSLTNGNFKDDGNKKVTVVSNKAELNEIDNTTGKFADFNGKYIDVNQSDDGLNTITDKLGKLTLNVNMELSNV